ncbi:cytochrome b-c1 complex subunit Rieske, mitochondrial-like [Colias croceus]|uniref:cytochrome b-c1 complex subunit Rieske, mitochondrial-like n=1 Tax=Colias crocea TaxID=72248 RepID=UPI001E27F5F9|nr:cytochrome b-c1 complex subunit Rieske, mitochondrial-like [Colias croceus]
MNYLSNGSFIRYGKLKLWENCCRQIHPPTSLNENKSNKARSYAQRRTKIYGYTLKLSPLFTQVRFQKDYPRLHRDNEFPNFDYYRKNEFKDLSKTTWGAGNKKPGITYTIGFFGLMCATYGVKSELVHFITYMAAAADVLALASIEVDISNIAPGMCLSYKWRGKPLFIKHRTESEINAEAGTPLSVLRDPQTPEQRMIKQEWLIVIGICTHLGCVPVPNSGDYNGGFYCPCHGSHYDNAGRTRKGPAPLNLEVPSYRFVSDNVVLVGE